MSTQQAFEAEPAVTGQAPAMIPVASKVGHPHEFQQTPVLSLKLAVSRYDVATVEAREDHEILVSFEDAFASPIDYSEIPHDDLVYVFRAVDELRNYLSRPKKSSGLDITIQKHIPFDTYLGGRAAASAAVLVALSSLWEASISREDLARFAHRVGDGVAESITGGVVITHQTAFEEQVTPVLVQGEIALVIVPAAPDLEEEETLQNVHRLRQANNDDTDRSVLEFEAELIQAVAQGEAKQLALMMHNDFQSALVSILPDHNDWLTAGMTEGALAAQTIDRGPSLVFLAENVADATELAERFEQRMEITAVAQFGPVAGAQLR